MKPFLILASLFVALGSLPSSGAAQQERTVVPQPVITPIEVCPKGFRQQSITLTSSAPSPATPNLADFPTSPCSNGFESNFGGGTSNKCFKHTFTWKTPGPECRCLSGELTIRYKALQGGPAGSSSSANDQVYIYSGGSSLAGSQLYVGAVTTGQTGTKTIRLTCDMLKNNRLSFLVQDDTSVTSATLRVVYCCPPCPKGQTELTFPGISLRYCCDGKPGALHFCCTAQEKPSGPPTNSPNGN